MISPVLPTYRRADLVFARGAGDLFPYASEVGGALKVKPFFGEAVIYQMHMGVVKARKHKPPAGV